MLKVYTYSNCDTCRRAMNWLRDQQVEVEEHPIRENPPTRGELKAMLAAQGGVMRKLFNTSGRDYREQGIGEKLPNLNEAQAFDLLSGNGNLVKRPFLIGDGLGLVGFNPATWAETLPTTRKRK